MSGRLVVDGEDEMYFLYQDGELLSFCVLISSGMYNDEIVFLLGENEAKKFSEGGKGYLDALAKEVRRNPAIYRSRSK